MNMNAEFYATIIFTCVDYTTIIWRHSKVQCRSYDLGQQTYAQRYARTVPSGSLGVWGPHTLMQYLLHFMRRVVYTSNFRMRKLLFVTQKLTCQLVNNFTCHMKIGHFISSTRANKKLPHKNCSCNRAFKLKFGIMYSSGKCHDTRKQKLQISKT